MNHLKVVARLFLFCLWLAPVSPPNAQSQPITSNVMGWDLTYKTLLERNDFGVTRFSWLTSADEYRSPVLPLLENWKGAPIKASVLIEFPAGHGNTHGALWFVRTSSGASSHFVLVGAPSFSESNEELELEVFDNILRTVSSWQQLPRLPDGFSGADYCGFLSIYDGQDARQLLLTADDFTLADEDGRRRDKLGRAAMLLRPFIDKQMPMGDK